MKKRIVFLLVLAVVVGLSACKTAPQQNATEATNTETATTEETSVPTEATSAPTEIPATDETANGASTDETAETAVTTDATKVPTTAPTEAPTTAPTTESTEAPTEEPHSEFYAAGVSVDEIVAHFNKVVLDMEDTTGTGENAFVQRWDQPICYRIEGMPSQRDAQIFHDLEKQLNAVEGFPSIQAAKGLEQNVTIYFLKDAEYETQFSHMMNGESEDGVVQVWHNDSNGIYSGRIGYRRDAAQETRDAVIPEKLLELLGINDAVLQKKEATGKKNSPTVELSDLDWAVIKLLYNPRVHSGMNADECEMIIRELYY